MASRTRRKSSRRAQPQQLFFKTRLGRFFVGASDKLLAGNLHSPMQSLIRYLNQTSAVFMAGLEKSGSFVDHAIQVKDVLKSGEILVLDNEYIYTYIIPGDPKNPSPYGVSTYYGAKVIFKTPDENMYVVTLPVEASQCAPKPEHLLNLHASLEVIQKLRCDMYDNALIPVALANKLVSLSAHPSATILQRFATTTIGH